MYEIKKESFGIELKFSGIIHEDEMRKWLLESDDFLARYDMPSFHAYVDMVSLQILDKNTRYIMELGQRLYKSKGMVRSAVIVSDISLKVQFRDIAKKTHILENERYISVEKNVNHRKIALDWLVNGVDPYKSEGL